MPIPELGVLLQVHNPEIAERIRNGDAPEKQ